MTDRIWFGEAQAIEGHVFESAAEKLKVEEEVIRAIWQVESGNRCYLKDGSVIRRYEPHHFPGTGFDWRDSLNIPSDEREKMFLQAYRESPEKACAATSWGGSQIMGFNAGKAGYGSASIMVEAMARSAEEQVRATVNLMIAWNLDEDIRNKDWHAIATRWNGSGKADSYARKLERAYRRAGQPGSPAVLRKGATGAGVRRLQQLMGITVDGIFGRKTEEAVKELQKSNSLQVDGVVGPSTWGVLTEDPPKKETGGFLGDLKDKAADFGRDMIIGPRMGS